MSPSVLNRLSAPGGLTELSDDALAEWSAKVSQMIDTAIAGNPQRFSSDAPRSQFFNPTTTAIADDAREKPIFWFAFPKKVAATASTSTERWQRADADRGVQDEYCEWAVQRRASDGKIVRVTFTSETPEYWEHLASSDPATLLALYSQFVGQVVPREDVFGADGRYRPLNKWNSSTDVGPIHLTQGSNFMSAAIELVAAATLVRVIGGRVLVSEQELIRCSQYGDPRRNSDPHIGAQVNELARMQADVTMADPPGLYILGVNVGGWQTPDGADPQDFWRPVRGIANRAVRCVFEVPPEKPYVVGDIRIQGQPIELGAQIADFVTVMARGLACRFGQSTTTAMTACRGRL